MFDQECVPYAPALIESMRSVGYSFSSAIADLIDNSISAHAKTIDILAEPNETNPSLIILDDGDGMDKEKIFEAMRYGSNPLDIRDANDLGRFGLGLKSASLSQCRKLVVVSKHNHCINAYSWDLDYINSQGRWALKGFSDSEISEFPHIELLKQLQSGTYIYLSEFDRIKEATGNISETFNKNLNEMSEHLSLVFHRFIEEGLVIRVNNLPIESRDPFLLSHMATQRKRETIISIGENKITLKPFILPHFSKLSESDLKKVGGKEALKSEQGFYVYRNRRLIIWGTWFKLERKDELNKLARVRVDIPNSLDYMWSIDIKKSSATLPDIIKKNMYNAVIESVSGSESVHTFRSRKETTTEIDYIWERAKTRTGYEYLINRSIPQLQLLAQSLDDKQTKLLNIVLKTLENSFPVNAMYVDVAKGVIEGKKVEEDPEMVETMWSEIRENIEFVITHKLPVVDYYLAFMKTEPYCNSAEIKTRIEMEIAKYD